MAIRTVNADRPLLHRARTYACSALGAVSSVTAESASMCGQNQVELLVMPHLSAGPRKKKVITGIISLPPQGKNIDTVKYRPLPII